MDLCKRYNLFSDNSNLICVKICSDHLIKIKFVSQNDLLVSFEKLKILASSAIFMYNSFYLSNNSKSEDIIKSLTEVSNAKTFESIPIFTIYFKMDNYIDDHTPVVEFKNSLKSFKHTITINYICLIDKLSDEIYSCLVKSFYTFLSDYYKALTFIWSKIGYVPKSLCNSYFLNETYIYSINYPYEVNENEEEQWRQLIHEYYELSTDAPLFRRGQALFSASLLDKWLGSSSNFLVCPHLSMKDLPNGTSYLIKGRYTYKHYLQDGWDDKNWGCAYRSLQTIISWLMWQGEVTPGPLPSLNDIQHALFKCGDKPKQFIGSRQWIGSLEVNFCLQELYKIDCRVLHVPRGSQMPQMAVPALIQHFSKGGGPVMIGGGQLAHTIIGIFVPEPKALDEMLDYSKSRYLILDPHFTGPSGDLKLVLDKGWCGWKMQNFWKSDVYYNLCFAPPIRTGSV